jgi:hypothetical protein
MASNRPDSIPPEVVLNPPEADTFDNPPTIFDAKKKRNT